MLRPLAVLLLAAAPAAAQDASPYFTVEFPSPAYDAPPCAMVRDGATFLFALSAAPGLELAQIRVEDVTEGRADPAWETLALGLPDVAGVSADGLRSSIDFAEPWAPGGVAAEALLIATPAFDGAPSLLRFSAVDVEGGTLEGPTLLAVTDPAACGG